MESYLLLSSIVVPLLAGVLLLFSGREAGPLTKPIAGLGFVWPLVAAVVALFQFAPDAAHGFAFLNDWDVGLGNLLGIHLKLGLNGISLPLFLLAGIVGLASGLYALRSEAERLPLYLGLLLVMHAGLMGVFCSVDIFFIYFFHELALVPTFIMIGIWGGHGRRVAAMEMTVYLTLGAMLSLIGLIALYFKMGVDSFDLIVLKSALAGEGISELASRNIFGLLLFGLGILVSLFPFHSWAPRGYAAAPSSATMLHAGVLKKFGLYVLIQVAAPLLTVGSAWWTDALVWLALGNIVVIGLITLSQRDLKLMLGYASVMHMGYAFLGLATWSVLGVGGAVLMMFAHGLSVSLLFLLATSIQHRTNTFDLHEMGGLGSKTPVLAAFFVAATMASLGLPGFANFWGEFAIFVALWQTPWVLFVAATGIVISAIYGLRAVARIFYGQPTAPLQAVLEKQEVRDLSWGERLPALILLFALLVAGVWPSLLGDWVNKEVSASYPEPKPAVVSQSVNF